MDKISMVLAIAIVLLVVCFVIWLRNEKKVSENIQRAILFMTTLFIVTVIFLLIQDSYGSSTVDWQGFEITADRRAGEVTIERKDHGSSKLEFCSGENQVGLYYEQGERITFSYDDWRKRQYVPNLYLLSSEIVSEGGLTEKARAELVVDEKTCEVKPVTFKVCSELADEIMSRQKKIDEQYHQQQEE